MPDEITRSWWKRREALLDRYRSERAQNEAILRGMVERIESILDAAGITATVRGRLKRFEAFYRKLLERAGAAGEVEDPFTFITDLLGIRVVTPFVEDIGRIADLLQGHFEFREVDDKGAALSVQEFGYVSTHLLVALPEDLESGAGRPGIEVVEIQLRTTLQDAWAEVEHELVYKAGLDVVDRQIRRKLLALNATLSLADTIFQEIRDYQKQRTQTLLRQHQALMDRVSTIPEKMGRIWRGEAPISAGQALGEVERPGTIDTHEDPEAVLANLVVRALQAHLDADLETAVELYTRVLAAQPTYAILNHRGIAYFTMGEYEKAIADFTAAIELAPDQARAYTNRGMAYRMADQPEAALADFDRSLAIDPFWADSLYGRALAHFDLGNIPAALEDCDRAIAIKPDFKQVLRFKRFIQDH